MTEHATVPNERGSLAIRDLLAATTSALQTLAEGWDEAAVEAWTQAVTASRGRVVLSGMGKSGLIAQKIAATLASTGCPSFYLHPAEALHGDLGMVTSEDSLLILSNSGETEEVLRLLPSLLRLGVPIAAITAQRESTLAKAANWVFSYQLPNGEGCPLAIAPMASTTLQLIWGDLLSVSQMVAKGFSAEGFARLHPAGSLGSKLMRTKDLMHRDIPTVHPSTTLVGVLSSMTRGRLGMAVILDQGRLKGVVSDGDIRRGIARAEKEGLNPLDLTAHELGTPTPRTIRPDTFALEGARTMEALKITFLVVADNEEVHGVLHIHDLLGAKVI